MPRRTIDRRSTIIAGATCTREHAKKYDIDGNTSVKQRCTERVERNERKRVKKEKRENTKRESEEHSWKYRGNGARGREDCSGELVAGQFNPERDCSSEST